MRNGNRIISLPHAWIREKGDPEDIRMMVGNLILISTKEDSDILDKAIDCLAQVGLFNPLTQTGLEIVRAE
jgi:hypothetical protein